MVLEESANENVRSVINNVKITARRRGLPDPLAIHRQKRNQFWRAGSAVCANFYHPFDFIAFKCLHHPAI